MGLTALRDIATIEEIQSDELSGETVSVDAHNWLYKYMIPTVQYTNSDAYTTPDGIELPAVLGLLQGLKRFYKNDITPVFVYDGVAHDLKAEEIARRKEKKQDAESEYESHVDAGNEIEAARYDARSQHLDGNMIAATQQVLDALDIPFIEAHGAGEAQAAYMAEQSDTISSIVSDDYDSLLFGAPSMIRNFTSSEPHERLYLEDVLESNNISLDDLIWYALFCGTDYNNGAYGYGPKTSLDVVQDEDVETRRELLLENDEELTESQLDAILSLLQDPQTMDEYPEPAGFVAVTQAELEEVVFDELKLTSDSVTKAVNSLGDVLPNESSLSSWT